MDFFSFFRKKQTPPSGSVAKDRLKLVLVHDRVNCSSQVLEMLKRLHDAGNTVVLITHDNSIAVQAQRIIRLEDGHVIYDGDAHDPKAVVTLELVGEGAEA